MPDRLELQIEAPVTTEATQEEEEALLTAQAVFWDELRATVAERLSRGDRSMARVYARKERGPDTRVLLRSGDRVLLKRR